MSRRTFLVTGATGDTGGATVEQILVRGHHVRALAHRQDDRAKRLQGLGAEVVFGDFLNLDDVLRRSGFEGGRSTGNARVRLVDTALRDNWWIRLKMHGQNAFGYPA